MEDVTEGVLSKASSINSFECRKFMQKRLASISKTAFCAVSRTLMSINIKHFTRWNANRCYSSYSLRTTHLVIETFQILSPTASLIFKAAKLFHQWYEEKRSMKLHIHNSNIIGNIKTSNLLQVVAICMFTFCDCLTWNKTKNITNSWQCTVWAGNHL